MPHKHTFYLLSWWTFKTHQISYRLFLPTTGFTQIWQF